ncbi:ROK family transcriptional regulator [Rhodocaloribacter litoris]|uniref:ROK family transcriptional regulator n=1 Tax=Rhodocaloribacter litoris TaxID=2558931 RepID=UPI0014231F36|nr:ROK family transcriptional regulator [Rhodocaloribacter litoris]QXD15449.1 ROK family transcriptional regulator [Rhodocaloribacter litoris]GIV60366.1 MAG: sugar kinase [Rhodothermaceae bacterium]
MLTGTNLTYTKEYNLRIVHETIRLYGPLSRAEIARRTELTPQTVSNLVRDLMALDLIVESGRRQEGRGAPSITLALNPDGAYSIGLDLDRDHLTALLVDHAGTVRQRIHHHLDFPSPDEALALMVETVHELTARQGLNLAQVRGVGIGVPGPMNIAESNGRTYLINPKAFKGWHDVPIADLLHQRLGIPVFLENNATAAAMGERWYGAGQHLSSFFYFYFGSGLGGGLVVQGQPYEGFTGNAGEIGYFPAFSTEKPCLDLEREHVGQHFNLPRLYRILQAEGLEAGTPEDLERLFEARNPLLLAWIDSAAHHLSWLALAVEYLVDPEAVFFGGRLADSILNALLERVGERLPALRISGKRTHPEYLIATAGIDAGALGVATLPIYEIFAPVHRILVKQPDGRPVLHPAR